MTENRVKIVATLGPATNSQEKITALAHAGVNVFRINMSHATPSQVHENVAWIRNTEKSLGRPLAIMGDLAGPKIRIGNVAPDTNLVTGQTVEIFEQAVDGNASRFSLNYPEIVRTINPNAFIYVDDGAVILTAKEQTENGVIAEVQVGGPLMSRKGFSSEGIAINSEGVLPKDKEAIEVLVKEDIDAIAVSFVQNAADIHKVRNLIPKDKKIMVVAKIETGKAVENIDEIIEAADAIMIARGDLGLAVPIEDVTEIQKDVIFRCLRAAKPVITATQMLESMTTKRIPTRAEASDVSNAILDGTDAVMLSAETATGQFPVEAVHQMSRLIRKYSPKVTEFTFTDTSNISDTVSNAAGVMADQTGARAIVAFTESGETARRISRHRHTKQPILALSPNLQTVRQLAFSWGVHPVHSNGAQNLEEAIRLSSEIAKNNTVRALASGERFVFTAGLQFGEPGSTNFVSVLTVS